MPGDPNDLRAKMAALLDELDAAFAALEPDKKRRPKRRKGATTAALTALGKQLRRALPPSYRAFLSACDGYRERDPVVGLFSTSEMKPRSAAQREAAEWKEADPDDAVARRGIVIGQTLDAHVLLDPNRTQDGELAVVVIDSESQHVTHRDVGAYLTACVAALRAQAARRVQRAEEEKAATERAAAGVVFEAVRDVAFSPDGCFVATWSEDVQLWDVRASGAVRDRARWAPLLRALPRRASVITGALRLEFSEDGRSLRLGGDAWSIPDGAPTAPTGRYALGAGRLLPTREGGRIVPAEVSSANGAWIARIEDRNVLVRGGGATRTYPGLGPPIAFSPDGKLLAAAHRFQRREGLRLWDLSDA
jgi:hypothetical protein